MNMISFAFGWRYANKHMHWLTQWALPKHRVHLWVHRYASLCIGGRWYHHERRARFVLFSYFNVMGILDGPDCILVTGEIWSEPSEITFLWLLCKDWCKHIDACEHKHLRHHNQPRKLGFDSFHLNYGQDLSRINLIENSCVPSKPSGQELSLHCPLVGSHDNGTEVNSPSESFSKPQLQRNRHVLFCLIPSSLSQCPFPHP